MFCRGWPPLLVISPLRHVTRPPASRPQLPRKRRQQVILDLDSDAKRLLAGLQRQVQRAAALAAFTRHVAAPNSALHGRYVQLEVARQVMATEAQQNIASGGAAPSAAW